MGVVITPIFWNVRRDRKCHHPAQEMSSPGARNVITRRKKCHHPAQEMSSPGARNVITRLVRVIQMKEQGIYGFV
jgi:hypothetical protein